MLVIKTRMIGLPYGEKNYEDIRVQVGRERRSRSFYTTGTSFPLFFCIFQFLTVIFNGSPSVIKLIRLLSAFCCRSMKFYYGPYATNMFIKNKHAISRK